MSDDEKLLSRVRALLDSPFLFAGEQDELAAAALREAVAEEQNRNPLLLAEAEGRASRRGKLAAGGGPLPSAQEVYGILGRDDEEPSDDDKESLSDILDTAVRGLEAGPLGSDEYRAAASLRSAESSPTDRGVAPELQARDKAPGSTAEQILARNEAYGPPPQSFIDALRVVVPDEEDVGGTGGDHVELIPPDAAWSASPAKDSIPLPDGSEHRKPVTLEMRYRGDGGQQVTMFVAEFYEQAGRPGLDLELAQRAADALNAVVGEEAEPMSDSEQALLGDEGPPRPCLGP